MAAPTRSIERLIDSRLYEHLVMNHRVSVMDGRIGWTVQRYRAIGGRFHQGGKSLHGPNGFVSHAAAA